MIDLRHRLLPLAPRVSRATLLRLCVHLFIFIVTPAKIPRKRPMLESPPLSKPNSLVTLSLQLAQAAPPPPRDSESERVSTFATGERPVVVVVIFLLGQIFFLGFNHGSHLHPRIHGRGGTIASSLGRTVGLRQEEKVETCLRQVRDMRQEDGSLGLERSPLF